MENSTQNSTSTRLQPSPQEASQAIKPTWSSGQTVHWQRNVKILFLIRLNCETNSCKILNNFFFECHNPNKMCHSHDHAVTNSLCVFLCFPVLPCLSVCLLVWVWSPFFTLFQHRSYCTPALFQESPSLSAPLHRHLILLAWASPPHLHFNPSSV